MGISKIATKTAEAFSAAGKKITKTISAQKNFKTTMEKCKEKLNHDLDALASVRKAQVTKPKLLDDTQNVIKKEVLAANPDFHEGMTYKLAKEGFFNGDFHEGMTYKLAKEGVFKGKSTAERAVRGAKEVMAATKMSDVPKSAMESAEVFKEFGETKAEKLLKQQELKAELMKKHGEELAEKIKRQAKKQAIKQAMEERIKKLSLLDDLFYRGI